MLAQNFKTAADLSLTEREHSALIGVLGMLERDEVRHVPVKRTFKSRLAPREKTYLFNMEHFYTKSDCGTAACIAGAADLFFGSAFIVHAGFGAGLRFALSRQARELFAPRAISEDDWSQITTAQAAAALRSYLTTGEANWAEALERRSA